MNSTASFDANTSSPNANLPFDFNTHSTIHTHLSNLADHLYALAQNLSKTHPLSQHEPPSIETVTSDLLSLNAALNTYHTTLRPIVQPLSGDPMLLGAERFIARLKEHAALLSRVEARKHAIRHVREEIGKVQCKKGGLRRDLRFTEKRIERLVKELRFLVYADDASTDLPSHTRRLTFGGKLVVVDIDFAIQTDASSIAPISKIALSIAPADDESISSLGPAAAQILTSNFQDQDGTSFLRNLNNLAVWDSCSDHPNEGLNCFAVLKGVEDALELIFRRELESATEAQVMSKGWGNVELNAHKLVGLSVAYAKDMSILVGVEARRAQYVHPPLQRVYLAPEEPFIAEDMDTLAHSPSSGFLRGVPNWVEPNLEGNLGVIHGARCSFVMDLSPPVVVSVDAAKKICEIVGYGGWNEVLSGVVKEEWILEDTMLEDLLFGSVPTYATVEVELPNGNAKHEYFYVSAMPIAARLVEKIPFSHPRQIFPLLQILRQWSRFNSLLTSCFPKGNMANSNPVEPKLEDLLNQVPISPRISITPIASPPSLIVVLQIGSMKRELRVSVLGNGEIDVNVEEHLRERVCSLVENAGIGVGIELLKKEFS